MNVTSRLRPARVACLLALAGALAATLPAAHGAERGPARRAAAGSVAETEARVIVKFKADAALMRAQAAHAAHAAAVLPQHAQALSARLGLSLTDGRAIGSRAQVLKARGLSSRELAERLAAQADVEYAVVDGRMRALALPNDLLYPGGQTTATPVVGQWYLRAPTSATIVDATSVVSAINAQAAWDITPGSASVAVAVLDTGVRRDHPDLAGKLLAGYDFIANTGVSVDGDGRDGDASDPGDWVTTAEVNQSGGQYYHCIEPDENGVYTGRDSSWHGTQTAGLIGAATNNGAGMASVGRNVMLLPVRVLGKCGGFNSDIQAGMLWAGGLSSSPVANPNPAKVINLSLGATGACTQDYIDVVAQLNAAGVVVVAAAGNEGLAVGIPANCPGVIAVAGVRHAGTKVGYSDLGPEVAIAAPAGNCVNPPGQPCLFPLLTTSNKGTTTPIATVDGGAIYTGDGDDASLGTSFSAPLVAGTVGLMLSANPALTPAQVKAALQSTARAFPSSGALSFDDATGMTHPVTACVAPSATAQGTECYCTTSTCGAGLLDAGAATATAFAAHASISAASASVSAGSAVTLDGSGSWPSGGASAISTYQWTIVSGSSIASLTSSTSSLATLQTSAGGSVTVDLTVTDSAGRQASSSIVITATAPPAASSGGGAMDLGWLLGWLAAVVGVWAVTPRRPRAEV